MVWAFAFTYAPGACVPWARPAAPPKFRESPVSPGHEPDAKASGSFCAQGLAAGANRTDTAPIDVDGMMRGNAG
jgi:hypothetical protein